MDERQKLKLLLIPNVIWDEIGMHSSFLQHEVSWANVEQF